MTSHENEVTMVPLSQIIIREGWNIRQDADSDVKELAGSVEKVGLLSPVILNENMEIIAGHRRYHAIKSLGWVDIPVVIKKVDSEAKERLIHIDENLERSDLNQPLREKALAEKYAMYKDLVKQGIKKPSDFIEETTKQTGLSKATVYRGINRHDNASDKVWEAYTHDEIGSAQMDELIRLPKKTQDKILRAVKRATSDETNYIVNEELAKLNVPADYAVKHPTKGTMHCDKLASITHLESQKYLELLKAVNYEQICYKADPGIWLKLKSVITDIELQVQKITRNDDVTCHE